MHVMADYRKEVGQRIRQLRLAKHMSQEDLAHEAHVTVKTVSRWENGRHSGYLGNVKALAEALGVEPEDITGTPPAPLGLGAPGLVTGPEERLVAIEEKLDQVIATLAGLTARRQDAVELDPQDASPADFLRAALRAVEAGPPTEEKPPRTG
jgi:transcriptional regulator with XRE-family HTH domain